MNAKQHFTLSAYASANRFCMVIAFCSAVVLILSACSKAGSSGPSDAEARTAYPYYSGMGEPVDFRKTNGESLIKDGQQYYIYHFQQANPLQPGIVWSQCPEGNTLFFGTRRIDGPTCALMTGSAASGLVISEGTVTFKQTENGWIAANGKITSWGYCPAKTELPDCYKIGLTRGTEFLDFNKGKRKY